MTDAPTINAESELVARLRDRALHRGCRDDGMYTEDDRALDRTAATTIERLHSAHEPDLFVWRDRDVGEPYERSELFLFGVAFMGWASTAFEDGYDGHFYNGLVLGNKPTLADAKALCEYHVQEAFNISPMSEPHVSAHEQGRREGIEMAAKVCDASAIKWEDGKTRLRPIDEEGGHMAEAHDRYFNYIENAKRLARDIRALCIERTE